MVSQGRRRQAVQCAFPSGFLALRESGGESPAAPNRLSPVDLSPVAGYSRRHVEHNAAVRALASCGF